MEKMHSITCRDTGETFLCPEQQDLLKAMRSAGKKSIPSGCFGGGCGICKIRILSGETASGKVSRAHLSLEEEADRWALACRTYPRSDVVFSVS